MRRGWLCFVVVLVCSSVQAQNWDEWVRQKRTQIRYLVKQIAGLQMYIELGQEGYGIAKDGLQMIGDIKNGDFDLHNGYFGSLSKVRSAIGNSGKVAEVTSLCEKIRKQVDGCKIVGNDKSILGDAYVEFVGATLDRFSNAVEDNFNEFQLLVSNNSYALTDDERLKRIDRIYVDMMRQYGFIKTFYNDVVMVGREREREFKGIDQLRRVWGAEF